MTPSRAALKAILDHCRVPLNAEQLDRLWAYHGMLRAANAELNLTRIHNFENMVLKHYVDSLLVLGLEDLPTPLVDMGTGAGLPGIPLAIARPDLRLVLADQRKNRAEFLESVRAKLNLNAVEVHAGRVGPRFPFQARGVITRAVAAIPETLDAVESVIEPGGRMLFMKGPDCDAEIAAFDASRRGTFRIVADHRYAIPGTSHERRLVVYERTDQQPANSPRARHEGPSREVISATNPTFQTARDLLSGRGVRKHGQALIAGKRIVSEVLEQAPDRVRAWLTDSDGAPPPPGHPDLLWLRLAVPLFRELDVSGTHAPLLLVSVPEFPSWSAAGPWPSGCTLFVPLQDPENVGAVIRSAAAFGVPRVVLCREAAHPFHPKAVRAAGTALFQVNLERGPALADLDPSQSPVPLIALATEGAGLAHEPWPERFGLVVGLEGPGLPETLRSGHCRRVPIEPNVESLNAAAATAIALYAWRSARGIVHDP